MIPRDLHIGNEDFDAIQIGDVVRVEIKKSRFQVNDTHILSIGQYLQTVHSVGSSGAGAGAGAAAEASVEEEQEQEEEKEQEEEAEEEA
jgi:ribosomal protein L12E/L44/L45/RPP1/RPP2